MKGSITDFELRVMGQLWDRGGKARVSDVLETWQAGFGVQRPGYTTVLKALQKLEAKGIVTHEAGDGRAYVYVALVDRREGAKDRLRQLVNTVFGGDRLAFAHAFLQDAKLSTDEMQELRDLLASYEEGETDE
jgi:BlaI family penicillinase repressor